MYPEIDRSLRLRLPPDVELACARDLPDDAARRSSLALADVAFGNVSPDWLREASQLRWLQLEAVGVDRYATASREAWFGRIQLTNLQGFFAIPVAETLVAGVLGLYRGLPTLGRLQRERRWALLEVRAGLRTLHGASAMVLGAGAIGAHVRRLLTAFGAVPTTFARTSPGAEIRSLEELDRHLPGADVVIACLPDTPATQLMFDAKRLARLKPGAILANGGRGSLIDETALLAGLRDGRLAGAVLDVTATEPLPAEHPLWGLPNVVLTQHTGGGSANEVSGKVDIFLRNLDRFRRGQPLENAVRIPFDRS